VGIPRIEARIVDIAVGKYMMPELRAETPFTDWNHIGRKYVRRSEADPWAKENQLAPSIALTRMILGGNVALSPLHI
jgi:hypothetical protein